MSVENVTCQIDQLGSLVGQFMNDYSKTVTEKVNQAVVEVSRETKDIVQSKANVDQWNRFPKRKGKYKKSIASKTQKSFNGTSGLVYAKGHEYSLTHLLENGHRLYIYPIGVTNRRTRAFKHWKDGEEYAIKELPNRIMNKMKG